MIFAPALETFSSDERLEAYLGVFHSYVNGTMPPSPRGAGIGSEFTLADMGAMGLIGNHILLAAALERASGTFFRFQKATARISDIVLTNPGNPDRDPLMGIARHCPRGKDVSDSSFACNIKHAIKDVFLFDQTKHHHRVSEVGNRCYQTWSLVRGIVRTVGYAVLRDVPPKPPHGVRITKQFRTLFLESKAVEAEENARVTELIDQLVALAGKGGEL
ncbi:hypothetical protein [Fimbriiglobus ruber]|uniref:Uncharacterized protein n=1 Tax=Fimbriiglobus ruber TaxID=1908690 RepID=A0A225D8S5_9BACT|nr:hypothetical protein [Fimbriiglobus ruber]OWK34938.1 hypothetical protein FRUB_09780 [Fimbriiglobus ruber]